MRVRFGECELDFDRRQLLRAGREVHLGPKAFRLLEVLLEARPKAVSKATLHGRVWQDAIVSEATLSSLLAELRVAIGDDPRRPRFIRTKYGFGYQFCGEATDVREGGKAAARSEFVYRLIWGTREIALEPGENVIGRTRETVVWIDSAAVSRRHAAVRIADGGATIEDLGSKNGTRVRGRAIAAACALQDGDEIRLGSVLLVFRAFPAAGSTRSTSRASRA